MNIEEAIQHVLEIYPRIFFALHARHTRDAQTGEVLSSHQMSILDHLDELSPTTLGMLAEHMGVTASTMSLNVDRLERHGYVIRKPDAVDKRRVNIFLSVSGARLREEKSVLDPERVRASLAKLTNQERTAAVHGLTLLMDAAQQLMHEQGSGYRASDSDAPRDEK